MNEVEINIPSDHVFERIVRDSAAIVARYLGFPDDRTADLQLAVSEAVTNAIEHGNQNHPDQKVGVYFMLLDDRLTVRVIDQGGAMPGLVPVARPVLDEKLLEENPRGLGIYLIQQLVDGVEMRSNDGQTEFIMWFNIHPSEHPAALPGRI